MYSRDLETYGNDKRPTEQTYAYEKRIADEAYRTDLCK